MGLSAYLSSTLTLRFVYPLQLLHVRDGVDLHPRPVGLLAEANPIVLGPDLNSNNARPCRAGVDLDMVGGIVPIRLRLTVVDLDPASLPLSPEPSPFRDLVQGLLESLYRDLPVRISSLDWCDANPPVIAGAGFHTNDLLHDLCREVFECVLLLALLLGLDLLCAFVKAHPACTGPIKLDTEK